MKNQLLIALMALASLFFIATGASAQFCTTCSYQGAAGIMERGDEEMNATTSGNAVGNVEIVPAAPSKEQAPIEFMPSGSSSNREELKPGWVPHEEAPGQSQPY